MSMSVGSSAQTATADVADAAAIEAAPRRNPLSFGLKTSYGLGAAIDAFTNTSLSYFFLFYATAVCGLSGTLAGLAAFIALVVDAIADPAIGLWTDNSRSRYGRRHPFMFVAAFPVAIAFGLIFSIPTQLSGWPLFAFIVTISLVLRFSLSLYNLPYIALGAELTDDYLERSTVVAYRVLFATLANFACFGLALGVYMTGKTGTLHRAAYTPFGWTGALILLICGLGAAYGTRSVIPRLHAAIPIAGSAMRLFLRELGEIFRSPSFVPLFLAVLIFFVAQGAAASLTLHANNYFWALPSWAIQAVFFGLVLGPIAGIPLTALASRYVEKRTISIASLCIFCLSQFLMPVAKIAGILPTGGAALYGLLVANAFILGAALVAGTIAFQSMLADAADEHEYLFGVRREGMFYAGLTLSAKAAGGLGGFIAGRALDIIHFPSNIAAQGAHLHLSADTIRNLGVIYGPLPALLTFTGLMFTFGYRLTREKHSNILVELSARKKA